MRKDRRALAIVVGTGLIARVAVLAYETRLPSFTHHRLDAELYDMAGRLIAGGDVALGNQVYHSSPLYSYLVGAVYAAFGAGPWGIRIVQLVLGIGTAVLVHEAARRLLGPRAALACGLAAALYGPLLFYETKLLSETLGTFLHALLFWLALGVLGRTRDDREAAVAASLPPPASSPPPLRQFFAIGLVLGLCVITRASALVLLVPLLVVVFGVRGTHRARAGAGAALIAGAALAIAPVTLRNLVVAGEPVLVTDSGGLNFYLGNGPGAHGSFRVPAELPVARNAPAQFLAFRAFAERETGRRLSAREVDAFWYRRTWAAIADDPGRWLRLMAEKAWLYVNARELPNAYDYAFHRLLHPVLALPLVQFGWIAPLAVFGTVLLAVRRGRPGLFVALWNSVMAAQVIAFFVVDRYRLPAVPALIVAAGAGGVSLAEWVRARRRGPLVASAAALAALALVVHWPKFPKPFDDEWFKLGYAYHVQGKLEHAETAYRRALAINAANLSARKNLALLLEARGDPAARAEWERLYEVARQKGATHHAEEARRRLGP